MPGIDHLSIRHAVQEAGEAAALGIPAVLLFGLPGRQGRGGLGRVGRRGRHPARHARDQGRAPRPAGHHRPLPVRVHEPRPLRRAARRRRGRQRRHARAARPHRGLPGRGRRRRRRAERHDGRARRRAARRARRARPLRDADHRLQREVRLRLLRPVPRGRRLRPPAFGDRRGYQMDPANARRGRARGASSTPPRAPTWSWSSPRCPTST